MSDVTVRALQNTVEFEPGVEFTTERTERVDQLIKDGRLEEVESEPNPDAPIVLTGSAEAIGKIEHKFDYTDTGHIAAVDPNTGDTVEADVQSGGVHYGKEDLAESLKRDDDDTPPAATESGDTSTAPETDPQPRRTGRSAKPKTDTK